MTDESRHPAFEESIIVPGRRAGSTGEAWQLAYPTVIGMMSATLMWTADTIMLGHVGKVELAAAGFGGVLIWTLYTFFVGIVQGVSTFVSQAKGRGNLRECSVFAWQGIYLSLAAAVVLSLFIWKMHWLLDLAKPDPEVVKECLRYSRARLFGAFFLLASFVFHSFFRGIGHMKTPMVIALASNGVNVVFDILLIFGVGPFPRLTALGAGAATSIADCSAALLGFILFLRPAIHRLYGTRTEHPFSIRDMKRLIRVGVPIGGQFFLDMGSFSVFMAAMGRLGTNQLAASQIGIQVLSFSFMPANGIAKAATTMVGQYIGAGKVALAETCAWVTVRMNLIYSLIVAAVLLCGRKYIFLAFNKDPEVVAAGLSIIPLLALFQIGDALQMAFTNSLSGAGDTRYPMVLIAVSAYGVFIPLALLFAYKLEMGIFGGWLGGVAHFSILSTFLYLRFRGGKWKTIKV